MSPTFKEWMMDGIWPEDISPKQAAAMIDYYVKLVGVNHVGIAADDMFSTELVVAFTKKNADMYADGVYMIGAFNRGATGSGELAKIMAAISDELWAPGFTNEDLAKDSCHRQPILVHSSASTIPLPGDRQMVLLATVRPSKYTIGNAT